MKQLINWVAVERRWIFDLPPIARLVFLEALCRARYDEKRINPNDGMELKLGQFCFGFDELSKRCGCSKKQVKTALKKVLRRGLLRDHKGTTKGSTAFIAEMLWIGSTEGPSEVPQRDYEGTPNNKNKNKNINIKCSTKSFKNHNPQVAEVIEYLNKRVGVEFRTGTKNSELVATLLVDGFTVQDMKAVIDHRHREWADKPEMAAYLRPSTLFRKSKFEEYLPQAQAFIRDFEALFGPIAEASDGEARS